jgi:hypothetical protein
MSVEARRTDLKARKEGARPVHSCKCPYSLSLPPAHHLLQCPWSTLPLAATVPVHAVLRTSLHLSRVRVPSIHLGPSLPHPPALGQATTCGPSSDPTASNCCQARLPMARSMQVRPPTRAIRRGLRHPARHSRRVLHCLTRCAWWALGLISRCNHPRALDCPGPQAVPALRCAPMSTKLQRHTS